MSSTSSDPTPVVLVHGWGGTYATTWRGFALERELQAVGRTVVEIDLPGHGQRPVSHEPSDYESIADQLAESLPEDVPIDAVGFSLGGKLLLQLAARYPQRFRRVATGGVGANIFRPENGEAISHALLEGLAPDAPAVVRLVIEDALASGNDLHGLSAVIRRPPRTVTPEDLKSVRSSLLLVVGTEDGIAGALEPLAAALPDAATEVVVGLDHMSTPSSPDFWRHVVAFLSDGGSRLP